jgi:hypothetical protein
MLSNSPENATRWGTSVQLTERGFNAAKRFWDLGSFERALRPQERIDTAHKKVGGIINTVLFSFNDYLLFKAEKSKTQKGA